MERLGRFLRLPIAERWLLIKAALLLLTIKLGLRLLPLQTLRRFLCRATGGLAILHPADHTSADKVAWAVEAASQHTPGAKSCLTQALAAQVLLTRRGYPALLHIGVARGERGRFQAHAWVESAGEILIGGAEPGQFTPLAVLEGEDL